MLICILSSCFQFLAKKKVSFFSLLQPWLSVLVFFITALFFFLPPLSGFPANNSHLFCVCSTLKLALNKNGIFQGMQPCIYLQKGRQWSNVQIDNTECRSSPPPKHDKASLASIFKTFKSLRTLQCCNATLMFTQPVVSGHFPFHCADF